MESKKLAAAIFFLAAVSMLSCTPLRYKENGARPQPEPPIRPAVSDSHAQEHERTILTTEMIDKYRLKPSDLDSVQFYLSKELVIQFESRRRNKRDTPHHEVELTKRTKTKTIRRLREERHDWNKWLALRPVTKYTEQPGLSGLD